MKYFLFITGCQYNYHDANYITHLLNKMGYVYVADEKVANLIIVLACSVRQKPVDRIFGKIKNWKSLPQKPKIIICGCILPTDKKKLLEKVDAIIKNKDIKKQLPKILDQKILNTKYKIRDTSYDFYPSDAEPKTAFIPIMQGCNNFCSYCVVPYTRGREVSRKSKDIIAEIKKDIQNGKKHIILLGQNVNSYNFKVQMSNVKCQTKNSKLNNHFTELLKKIDRIPENFDYNFMSANPRNFSDELIDFLPKAKKWNRHLHLPLQSGDDQVLRKMNRKYTSAQYFRLIFNLKSLILNLKLSTDIIVGFPDETQKQFNNTIKICKKIGFVKAFVSQYSPRPGTLAQKKYEDNVPRMEKKRRWSIINDLINSDH